MEYFKEKEIYLLGTISDSLFICEACSGGYIGKLVKYDKISSNIYERTNIQYFLNTYISGDLKSLFLNRRNYELVGKLDSNYVLTEDKINLIKE